MTTEGVGGLGAELPRLRIGAVLGSPHAPKWIVELLERIAQSDFTELSVVVVAPPEPPRQVGLARRLLGLYERADARFLETTKVFGPQPPEALARLASTVYATRLENVPDSFRPYSLDVVLALDVSPAALSSCARHGVWSIALGDPVRYAGEPSYFWEVHDSADVAAVVVRVDDGDVSRIVYRSYSALDPVSLSRNRTAATARAANAVLLRLRQLHGRGPGALSASTVDEAPAAVTTSEPSLRQVGRFLGRAAAGAVRRTVDWRLLEATWFLAYRRHGGALPREPLDGLSVIEAPPGRFYADPFLIEREGRHFLFFEDWVAADGRARISYLELPIRESSPEPVVALARSYHLSYPFVFEWEGDVYMTPESSAARRVELFRAERFPDRWVSERVLLDDVAAVDPTLLRHDGLFWLFVNLVPEGAATGDDELHVFWAESLDGEWTPHSGNPVVADVRSARPAGRIFEHGGKLIRPSQDCSRRYGYATVLNRIEELSEDRYREAPVARIGPGWLAGNLGTHSYARDNTFEVIDGYRRTPKIPRRRRPRT